jgi:hypothetical protein
MATYFTDHARARMQSRGISAAAIDLLLDYGASAHARRGREIVFFDKAARSSLARAEPAAARLARTYLIVASDGAVITAGHRHRRIPR